MYPNLRSKLDPLYRCKSWKRSGNVLNFSSRCRTFALFVQQCVHNVYVSYIYVFNGRSSNPVRRTVTRLKLLKYKISRNTQFLLNRLGETFQSNRLKFNGKHRDVWGSNASHSIKYFQICIQISIFYSRNRKIVNSMPFGSKLAQINYLDTEVVMYCNVQF